MEEMEEESMQNGQANVWHNMHGFAHSMALKCAVELRIADIINTNGHALTISQIASSINPPFLHIHRLHRIMRLLIQNNIFSSHQEQDDGETLYGLTPSSKWLIRDSELSLAPLVLMGTHPWLIAPWYHLSQCVKEDVIGFKEAHGHEMWDFACVNAECNKMLNEGMEHMAKILKRAILYGYKDGFHCLGSLVDVGGGTGVIIAHIVKAYPNIKGINFDLPHVISTAPVHNGVSHVSGDMFESIPNADAVFMKWIMHNWSDEDCVKILKNCRKAIPENKGKIIIVDLVLQPEGNNMFDEASLILDLAMMVHTSGGKERTELEWKHILEEGGFSRFTIIKLPAISSIIEAYPD